MNEQNLNPIRTESEARKKGAAGGRASGEARRAKRDLREHLQALLDCERDGRTGAEALAVAVFEKALSGDVKAVETVLAITGQTPRQTLPEISIPDAGNKTEWPKVTGAVLGAVTSGRITLDEARRVLLLAEIHRDAKQDAASHKHIADLIGNLSDF